MDASPPRSKKFALPSSDLKETQDPFGEKDDDKHEQQTIEKQPVFGHCTEEISQYDEDPRAKDRAEEIG